MSDEYLYLKRQVEQLTQRVRELERGQAAVPLRQGVGGSGAGLQLSTDAPEDVFEQTAAAGDGTEAAPINHLHELKFTTGDPQPVASSGSVGTSDYPSRHDHDHEGVYESGGKAYLPGGTCISHYDA